MIFIAASCPSNRLAAVTNLILFFWLVWRCFLHLQILIREFTI
jgi:hypothetical protein